MIVAYRNGAPVRLDEIANVVDGVENERQVAWVNDVRCVFLAINKQPGTNTVEVVENIKRLLPEFRREIPPAVQFATAFDASTSIRNSIRDVEFTLVLTVCVVVLVIFLFLRNLSATVDSRLRGAVLDCRHVRGDVPAALQPEQSVADGADAFGGLRGGRRHRHAGKHRAAHGDGQDAHGSRASRRRARSASRFFR